MSTSSPAAYAGLAVAGTAALAAAAALPALTADLVKRRGRTEREAPRPGTFSAAVGDSEGFEAVETGRRSEKSSVRYSGRIEISTDLN